MVDEVRNEISADVSSAVQFRDLHSGSIYINSTMINVPSGPLVHDKPLRVLAVDDDPKALRHVVALLREDPRVGAADGVPDAAGALRFIAGDVGEATPLDAVFLDVLMPGLDGWDLAKVLARLASPPRLVFVTAHKTRAVEAFDLEAVDYILKPVMADRLGRSVDRVLKSLSPDDVRGDGGS